MLVSVRGTRGTKSKEGQATGAVEPTPETLEAFAELARHGSTDLVELVLDMGRRARRIVPDCVGLSLGLFEDGLTFTLQASSEEIAALDAVQYLDGGPCVDAAHDDETIEAHAGDLIDENRWHLFARASAAAGVASSLTLPILSGEQVMGTVNLYAATVHAFAGHHEELATALGASAEHAVLNADLSFSTRLVAAEAPDRVAEQNEIDFALGIISASQHVDIPAARERLREAAARAGITEVQAARAVRGLLLSE
jgi:GAF domain-containing protein